MLDHADAIRKLVQASPTLDESLVDFWKEMRARTTAIDDFYVLAQHVHDAISYGWPIDLPEIFRLVEHFLDQGDDEVKAASSKFLQELLERDAQPETWTPHLGARSRDVARAWDEKRCRWTPGLYPELEREG